MGYELLVMAQDKRSWKKGYVVARKEQPCVWGSKEGPPFFVRIVIPDGDIKESDVLVEEWFSGAVTVTEVQPAGDKFRYLKVEPDAKYIGKSGENSEIKQSDRLDVVDRTGAKVVDHNANYTLFEVPKNISSEQFKSEFENYHLHTFDLRLKYIVSAIIDQALEMKDGRVELSKSAVLIKNRLDDNSDERVS